MVESTGVLGGILKPGVGPTVYPAACPSRTLLNHVTSTWGVLVLAALSEGTLRWSELRRAVQGVSEKMLAQTLQTLEKDGLVSRYQHPVMPPKVEYSLTELGQGLVERLLPLLDWVGEHVDIVAGGAASDAPAER
jgi:DNA-binding HxlR family transcriptional regulator